MPLAHNVHGIALGSNAGLHQNRHNYNLFNAFQTSWLLADKLQSPLYLPDGS
jgi:hypothetical protein